MNFRVHEKERLALDNVRARLSQTWSMRGQAEHSAEGWHEGENQEAEGKTGGV